MQFCKPDFDNGIVSLMGFLRGAMQHDVSQMPNIFQGTDVAYHLENAKHVVLVILDGLGHNYLSEQANSFLQSKLLGNLSSVFPSSTAPGVTSFLSGLSPAQHGIFGWFQWMRPIGQVCACLPFETRALGVSLAEHGVSPKDCFDFPSFFSSLSRPSCVYSPEEIVDSPYSTYASRGAARAGFSDWTDLVSTVQKKVQAASGPMYHHIYWPYFDSSCHRFGLYSAQTAKQFCVADKGVSDLVSGLAGEEVAMIITADHGMIDTTPQDRLTLEGFPDVANCLTMPLCGEPRAAFCHVRASARVDFPRIVAEQLGEYCECFTVSELIRAGWFGAELTDVPPYQYDALGDFVLIMKSHYALQDTVPGAAVKNFIGMHGGVTQAEMEIPVCWVAC